MVHACVHVCAFVYLLPSTSSTLIHFIPLFYCSVPTPAFALFTFLSLFLLLLYLPILFSLYSYFKKFFFLFFATFFSCSLGLQNWALQYRTHTHIKRVYVSLSEQRVKLYFSLHHFTKVNRKLYKRK